MDSAFQRPSNVAVYFTVDTKVNRATYGDGATVGDILAGNVEKPQGATILTQALD